MLGTHIPGETVFSRTCTNCVILICWICSAGSVLSRMDWRAAFVRLSAGSRTLCCVRVCGHSGGHGTSTFGCESVRIRGGRAFAFACVSVCVISAQRLNYCARYDGRECVMLTFVVTLGTILTPALLSIESQTYPRIFSNAFKLLSKFQLRRF